MVFSVFTLCSVMDLFQCFKEHAALISVYVQQTHCEKFLFNFRTVCCNGQHHFKVTDTTFPPCSIQFQGLKKYCIKRRENTEHHHGKTVLMKHFYTK